MSVTSIQTPSPIPLHLNTQAVGGQSGRFHLPPTRRQKNESNASSGGDPSPQPMNDALSLKRNGKTGSPGPNAKSCEQTLPSKKTTHSERARAAATVLNRYRIEYTNDWDFPESILYAQRQIQEALEQNAPIELVIPAFPFKSSNRSKKVLGPLPDEAERLSLLHLNGMCLAIRDVTKSDTYLTIVSDGITYNDILGVSDEEVWKYGQELRQMAEKNGCYYIRFSRICDLVGTEHASEDLTESLYLAKVAEYRGLLEANTPSGFDVLDAISSDPDISKTYKGYKKFLMSEREDRISRSRSQTERENSVIAKAMIVRGKAFAETVRMKYPGFIRLSIHPSNDTNKVSIVMLPQKNDIVMTPWHGAVVRGADGSVSMSHAILVPALTHDIAYVNGHPSYFRERSDVLNWPAMDVRFEYMYPCGIMVKPSSPTSVYPLSMVDMRKIHTLASTCSPVIFRGFSNAMGCRTLGAQEHGTNPVPPGRSAVIRGGMNAPITEFQSSSEVSASVMPVHCDNIRSNIQTQTGKLPEKEEVSDYSHFQYCVSQTSTKTGDSHMLFSSSDLFVRYLPQAYDIKKLENIRWSRRGDGDCHHVMESTPLIVRHPTRNSPCVRWQYPRSEWQIPCGPANIRINNGSQGLIPLVDSLLLDRRVCLRFSCREGDIIVSDNFTTLRTRTTFSPEPSRGITKSL